MELEQLEALALADDRAAALAGLVPGTADHAYWRGVHLQHAGRLDEVDALLEATKHLVGTYDERYVRLTRRQLLLRAGADVASVAERIRLEAGLWLDDQPEAAAAAVRHPSRLPDGLLDEDRLLDEAIGRSADLQYVADDALPQLVARAGRFDANQRRHLLQRLRHAAIPGLVPVIAADLADRNSRGFGTLTIHRLLTAAQLDELAALRPALRAEPAWVDARLLRMRPPAHVDVEFDLDARAAHLDALWAFVAPLPPAFNAVRAQVLHARLDLDRRRGVFDRARFAAYLALPRVTAYGNPRALEQVPGDQRASAGGGSDATGLPPLGDDEALVREFLERFLLDDDGAAFSDVLRADWLDDVRAAARLLAGAPDADRWAARLAPGRLAELRDRVELELTARNPARYAADAPVTLEVDVKNVPRLTVKVFRIDCVAYFLATGGEPDTALDLDGMVARDEQTIESDAPAIRRRRLTLPLPISSTT